MSGFKTVLCLLLVSVVAGEDEKKSVLPGRDVCGHQKVTSDDATGKNAHIGEFPWMALLKYQSEDGKDAGFRCIGTLISPYHILTTATCTTPKEVTLAGVRLGEHDLTVDPDCEDKERKQCSDPLKDFGIEEKVAHADFNRHTGENDIAVIKLDKEVTFTDTIKPICLPLPGSKSGQPGDNVTVSGWGRSITGDLITIKKRVLSTIITNEECAKDYSPKKEILDSHLCTRASRNNTEFVCVGDSGGPVMFYTDNVWEQVGIVSFGIGCGFTYADGNIKIEKYRDWIEENMRPWPTTS